MKRNALLIGNGGREAALAYKLNKERVLVYGNTSNPTIKRFARTAPEFSKETFFQDVSDFIVKEDIRLTVIGPEIYLAEGIVDYLRSKNLRVFGPSQKSAKIESDKSFAKKLMLKYNIPTAKFKIAESKKECESLAEEFSYPFLMKVSGLAAGKGALIIRDASDFSKGLNDIYEKNIFKDAADKVVLEEFMDGEEASLFCITDGKKVVPLPVSQDFKRAKDGDAGLNTGGMGSYSPCRILSETEISECIETIFLPTLYGLRKEEDSFTGVLFAGLMIKSKDIKVVEFNCRFGDPETQSIMPILKDGLYELMCESADLQLSTKEIKTNGLSATTVVVAAGGYPEDYKKGIELIIDDKNLDCNSLLFHAGTIETKDNVFESVGGRMLNFTSFDQTLEKSINRVYSNMDKFFFKDSFYRKDIGLKGLKYENI